MTKRKTTLAPTGDNVLVKCSTPGKSPGGILLPDVAQKGARIQFGEVLAVGNWVTENGNTACVPGATVLVDVDLAARVPDCPDDVLFVMPLKSVLAVML